MEGVSAEALRSAERVLRNRDLSAAALRTRLGAAGLDEPEAEAVVARLVATGLVDDGRLAHARARTLAARGQGNLLIDARLEDEGFGPEIREEAVGRLEPEVERAAAALQRTPPPERRRVAARLHRSGFAADAIESALVRLDAVLDAELR